MADQERSRKSRSRGSIPRIPWLWVLLGGLVIVVIAAILLQTQSRHSFLLQDGQKELLVLIRNDATGTYTVQYRGRGAVRLQSIKPMLAGQILHVDVKQMAVVKNGEQVVLEQPSGTLPANHEITLQPDDTFDIEVTLLGQSIGGNYLYGFRIGYSDGNSEQIYELTADFNYEIVVK